MSREEPGNDFHYFAAAIDGSNRNGTQIPADFLVCLLQTLWSECSLP
ncbi:MAG: hypothetical protein ABF483_05805 [Liquorilactobacillus nagelii]|jgi:hypothetical protein|nr:hypothetical protein [Liquorilactobacillus nagelii]MCI1922183.1 hypothetical protein [Liquorilactobacillus nagelii]MCI1977953.1 hypothetical protein [Liquorilactobacillus nagelii]